MTPSSRVQLVQARAEAPPPWLSFCLPDRLLEGRSTRSPLVHGAFKELDCIPEESLRTKGHRLIGLIDSLEACLRPSIPFGARTLTPGRSPHPSARHTLAPTRSNVISGIMASGISWAASPQQMHAGSLVTCEIFFTEDTNSFERCHSSGTDALCPVLA